VHPDRQVIPASLDPRIIVSPFTWPPPAAAWAQLRGLEDLDDARLLRLRFLK
jgi:hypothetical protein